MSEATKLLIDSRVDAIRTITLILAQKRASVILAELDDQVTAMRERLAASELAMDAAGAKVKETGKALRAARAASAGVARALAEHQGTLADQSTARHGVQNAKGDLADLVARQRVLQTLPSPDPADLAALGLT